MAWWNREAIPPTGVVITALAGGRDVASDPTFLGDGQMADEARGFLELRIVTSGCAVRVHRWGGPSEADMEPLDPSYYSEVTTKGIAAIEWPAPPPPFFQTRLEVFHTTGGDGVVELSLLQTCRRD